MTSQSDFSNVAGVSIPPGLTRPFSLVGPDLERVNRILFDSLQSRHPYIDEIVRYSFQLGGKRLRPMLVLLAGKACGHIGNEHILAGAALELIHTGTLVHDDILDGATFRRHLETIHVKWDSHSAVLVGDLLLTLAMDLMTQCDDTNAWRLLCRACKATCEGELMQNAEQGRFDMTRDEYLQIIGGKTAKLLQCACGLGAILAAAPDTLADKFFRFGFNLGLAFQIVDDVLDLIGEEENMGKTLGTDILNGKPTLPLILWFERAGTKEKADMIDLLNDKGADDRKRIILVRERLNDLGTVDAACEESQTLVRLALNELEEESALFTPDHLPTPPLEALRDLADFVVNRNR